MTGQIFPNEAKINKNRTKQGETEQKPNKFLAVISLISSTFAYVELK